MNQGEIRAEVIEVLKPFIRRAPSGLVVGDDSRLEDDLKIDSADLIDLVLSLEERFHITVSDEALRDFTTVGSVVEFVSRAPGADQVGGPGREMAR
jgi:acyl carrier protein